MEAKIWLAPVKVAKSINFPDHEMHEDVEKPNMIESVRCTDDDLVVKLTDGRQLSVPLWWYPRLHGATPEQRARSEIGAYGIHWEEIDEDIELAGLFVGAKAPGAASTAKEPHPVER